MADFDDAWVERGTFNGRIGACVASAVHGGVWDCNNIAVIENKSKYFWPRRILTPEISYVCRNDLDIFIYCRYAEKFCSFW